MAIGLISVSLAFAQTQTTPAAGNFKGDLLKQIADVEKKLVSLAEAFPTRSIRGVRGRVCVR